MSRVTSSVARRKRDHLERATRTISILTSRSSQTQVPHPLRFHLPREWARRVRLFEGVADVSISSRSNISHIHRLVVPQAPRGAFALSQHTYQSVHFHSRAVMVVSGVQLPPVADLVADARPVAFSTLGTGRPEPPKCIEPMSVDTRRATIVAGMSAAVWGCSIRCGDRESRRAGGEALMVSARNRGSAPLEACQKSAVPNEMGYCMHNLS